MFNKNNKNKALIKTFHKRDVVALEITIKKKTYQLLWYDIAIVFPVILLVLMIIILFLLKYAELLIGSKEFMIDKLLIANEELETLLKLFQTFNTGLIESLKQSNLENLISFKFFLSVLGKLGLYKYPTVQSIYPLIKYYRVKDWAGQLHHYTETFTQEEIKLIGKFIINSYRRLREFFDSF